MKIISTNSTPKMVFSIPFWQRLKVRLSLIKEKTQRAHIGRPIPQRLIFCYFFFGYRSKLAFFFANIISDFFLFRAESRLFFSENRKVSLKNLFLFCNELHQFGKKVGVFHFRYRLIRKFFRIWDSRKITIAQMGG